MGVERSKEEWSEKTRKKEKENEMAKVKIDSE